MSHVIWHLRPNEQTQKLQLPQLLGLEKKHVSVAQYTSHQRSFGEVNHLHGNAFRPSPGKDAFLSALNIIATTKRETTVPPGVGTNGILRLPSSEIIIHVP